MNFIGFQGNERLKASLNSIEKQNRMPHVIIINGGTEESRQELSIHLAMWAVCNSNGERPCGECKNCINAKAKAHSDVYFAKGEGKTNIYNKDEINRIIRDASIKPNQADTKVYVLSECDRRFPVISQNVFLKTLEEPPQDVLFILTCENSKVLLSTILSRATVFTLESKTEINQELLDIAKEITLGIISKSEIQLLKATYKLSDRESSLEILSYVVLLLRDGLCVSVGAGADTDEDIAYRLSKKLRKTQYLKLIEITEDAQKKVTQNVSLKLIGTWLCAEYRRITWQR
ncbi:MAG: hypothetical protein ACI4Q8_07170 [Ruminococcus sp.]